MVGLHDCKQLALDFTQVQSPTEHDAVHNQWTQGPYLPPVRVILVDNLEKVSGSKLEPGFLTRDEVVSSRFVVEMGLHKHLQEGKEDCVSCGGKVWRRGEGSEGGCRRPWDH